jgi:acyl carrier protein
MNIFFFGGHSMSEREKLALIEEILELEEGELTPDANLDDIDTWDSMAALSLIVMVDENFGKTLSAADVRQFETVGDILEKME